MPDQDGTGAGQRGGQPGPASARLSPVRLHQAVLAVALLVPAAVFAAAAWWNRGEVLADGADAVERTVAVMQEHVGKVLDTTDLILDRLEDHLRGRDQAAVAAAETSAFLVRLKAPFDQIVSIWVSGPDGHVLAGTQDWDRSVTITDREFFRVHLDRERSDGVNQTGGVNQSGGVNQDGARGASHVSAPFNGRATTAPSFAISRRRSGPDGRFEGVIHVAFSPAYFTRFFAGIAPPFAHAAGLVRADGEILAQDPPIGRPTRLGPASLLLRGMPRDDTPAVALMGMAPDHIGPERIMVHRQVGRWPVRVYFAAQPEAMLGRWRQNLRAYGLVAGAAAVTLLAVAWLALRQARAAEAAGAALRREAAARAAAEAQQAAEARFRAVFESRAVGMAVFDLGSGVPVLVNDRLLEMTGSSRGEFEANGWDWHRITPPEHLARDEEAIRQALRRGWWDPFEKDYLRPGGQRIPVRLSSAPMPGEPGRVVVLVQDISEQRAAEQRRDLLMREVDHRAKNALATARAALRLTRAPTLEDFVREVDGRIGALADALLLLSTTQWTGVDLETLLRRELAPFLGGTHPGKPQAALAGPRLRIVATAVQPLAMAMHELATNATKYGALSVVGGRLSLDWGRADGLLWLEWREIDGPPVVAPPAASGFGTRVLRATVTHQLGGRLRLAWNPEGLTCRIELPAGRVLGKVEAAAADGPSRPFSGPPL